MSTDFFIDNASIYSTGLLAASTSRFMSSCLRAKKENESIILTEENKNLIENAKSFLTDILAGQNLITRKGKVSPSVTGIMAFNHAIQVMSKPTGMKISPPSTADELEEFFETMLSVFEKVSQSNIKDIAEEKIDVTHQFFSMLADMFLDKVQTFSRSEAKIFQSI